ncbi:hypothetical protein DL764_001556 [Monosporascus ibericus]|uniref:Uncharacterized protein n=1 Tax=Monosporascus ibericus TaxID=155417 RepID=A0A4Q4TNZ5_9PEZI|nr:hypothetical protein DL764_001556 [Monosporascus ibericus]
MDRRNDSAEHQSAQQKAQLGKAENFGGTEDHRKPNAVGPCAASYRGHEEHKTETGVRQQYDACSASKSSNGGKVSGGKVRARCGGPVPIQ